MVQGSLQHPDVEFGIVRDDNVGTGQPGQKLRRNGWEFVSVQHIQVSQAVIR